MKHTLRKYLSSRGSALFMVLSTMTALLIVVMAMYFSVVSSRSVQYAVFNQEQSYQSSISVADAVIAGLNDGKLDKLSGEFFKLKVGETKSTEGNNFASLVGTGTKEDDVNIGAYDVTVTRLNDEGEYYVYDFTVTAMVNGVTETTHTLVRLSADTPTPPPAGKTFTATGYLPNENWLGRGYYYDEVHIDSEYCILGLGYGVNESVSPQIFGDFTAAGSVEINSLNQNDSYDPKASGKPRQWAIGGNLKLNKTLASTNASNWLNHGTDDEHTKLIIGGDLYIEDNEALYIPPNVDIYVLGDCYMGTSNSKGNLFVGGRLYAQGNLYGGGVPIWAYSSNGNGYVYLSNTDDIDEYSKGPYGNTNDRVEMWGDTDEAKAIFSKDDIVEKLNIAIGSNSYPKWEPEVDNLTPVDIAFNSYGGGDVSGLPDPINGGVIPNNTSVFKDNALKYSATNKSCTIGNIYDVAPLNSYASGTNDYYIIIDSGDDPQNVFTVRLLANRNLIMPDHANPDVAAPISNRTDSYDSDLGENETFMFRPYPYEVDDETTRMHVLIKGRGTVIFDIPQGVTYQASSWDFVGHMNWQALLGMNPSMVDGISKCVHTNCAGGTACEYSANGPDGKKIDGGFWCKTHECKVESDAKDVSELVSSFVDGVCLCYNRVGRKEIDKNFNLSALTGDYVDRDASGNFVYPNTNVWFVSCDENAEIRMSTTIQNVGIQGNATFGFVYAPYMTYSSAALSSGNGLRMAGGLIVSDLILNDRYAYVYVAPDRNYAELLGDNAIPLTPQGNRTWRKYGY